MDWVTEIRRAMEALGGHARYEDLYEYLEKTTNRNLTKHWKASVRRTIQQHSKDSESFSYTDVFAHLDRGHWGLRGKKISQAAIKKRQTLSPKEVFVEAHWRKLPERTELDLSDQISVETGFLAMQIFINERIGLGQSINSKSPLDVWREYVAKAINKELV